MKKIRENIGTLLLSYNNYVRRKVAHHYCLQKIKNNVVI